jgi:hypothetical protein
VEDTDPCVCAFFGAIPGYLATAERLVCVFDIGGTCNDIPVGRTFSIPSQGS